MPNPSTVPAYSGLPVTQAIPTNIRDSGLMSITSSAPECFVNQRFSAKLQAFMVSYVQMVNSTYAIHAV